MEKKNIGKLLALYPKPMTVVGAGRWQGELARRGAYGHHRPRPDSREHEQEPLYQSRNKEVEEALDKPRES